MSIADLLRRFGARLWIVVLIPALAMAITVFLVSDEATTFRATATVVVPAPIGFPPTPQIVNQAVEDFRSLMLSTAFREALSAETGIAAGPLAARLSSQRLRQSDIVEVTFKDRSPSVAVDVANAAAQTSIATTLAREVEVAQRVVDAAEAAYQAAPEGAEATALSALRNARSQLVAAQAAASIGGDLFVDPATQAREEPRRITVARNSIVVGGVAFALSLVLLAVWMLILPRSRRVPANVTALTNLIGDRAVGVDSEGESLFDRRAATDIIFRSDDLDIAVREMAAHDLDGSGVSTLEGLRMVAEDADDWEVFRQSANATAKDTLAHWPVRSTIVVSFIVETPDGETWYL